MNEMTEGVGKSSLISTFVSRYFSEVVPGIMTRVRLPPDPENACVTTIVDSQGGDAALISAVAALSLTNPASSDSFAALVERAESFRSQTGAANATTAAGGGSGGATDQTSAQKAASATPKEPAEASATGAAAGMDKVDSIVLVYDLDRVETFFRLENHWLPLIERCYNGKVRIVTVFCRYVEV
jgi:hypothetical protein